MLQSDQLSGMIDRATIVILTIILGKMVRLGWLGESDAAALTPFLVLVPALFWGWWNNRNKALVQSAAKIPGTIIVTSPELAAATPGQNNIVSNTNVEVKTK